jgi:hypothetical protein
MALDVTNWNPDAARIYLDCDQARMPLIHRHTLTEKAATLTSKSALELFPAAAAPDVLLAGLLLYLNGWTEAHEIAQGVDTREGSYLHAIVHRMEPDAGNSAYWFRRVGKHPLFPALAAEAEHIIAQQGIDQFKLSDGWDSQAFINFCQQALFEPGSANERAAIEIQHVEWRLLMEWCSQPAPSGLRLLRT